MFGLVDMLRVVFVEYDIHGNITFNSRCQDAILPLPTDSEFTTRHSPRLESNGPSADRSNCVVFGVVEIHPIS